MIAYFCHFREGNPVTSGERRWVSGYAGTPPTVVAVVPGCAGLTSLLLI